MVYGPNDLALKTSFWQELHHIRDSWSGMWLVSGDFNAIRTKSKKSGTNFIARVSNKFNTFVNGHNLLEYKLLGRRFTWSIGIDYALLDRFLCSIDWDDCNFSCILKDLSHYNSDHFPLILTTMLGTVRSNIIFRIDPIWLQDEDFNRLIPIWWQAYPLDQHNFGHSWQEKLKLRGKISRLAQKLYRS